MRPVEAVGHNGASDRVEKNLVFGGGEEGCARAEILVEAQFAAETAAVEAYLECGLVESFRQGGK